VTVSIAGIPTEIVNLIQDRTLERVFHDALFPRLLFRMEARAEVWPINLGERQVFTRSGLIPPKTTPLTPGSDPSPSTYAFEQWEAQACQFGDAIDTNMPTSYVTLASQYLRNTKTLGLNAGESLNRLVRNSIYRSYLGGETNTTEAIVAGVSQVQVANLLGFTEQLVNGALQPVSATSPIDVSFTTAGELDNQVIGAVPADPNNPLGPGTLTFANPVGNPIALRDGIQSSNAARRIRVGGGATVDAIAPNNILDLQSVISAVAILRSNLVPPCSDGLYHVHISPTAEAQIFADNQFQRLHQSLPEQMAYRDQAIGDLLGSRWYRNTETPNAENVGTLVDTSGGATTDFAASGTEINADVINQSGVPIERTIVMGGGAVYEKYLDESKFITESGVTGKIGQFTVTNGGVAVMTERIRFIARSPLDRLQQVYSQAWSWSGDFPVPSDQTTGPASRFKRAVVIESA